MRGWVLVWWCSSRPANGLGRPRRLEPQLGDPHPLVVEVHDLTVVAVEQACGDAGAVARAAVHPELAGRQGRHGVLDVLDRQVDGAGQVALGVLVALPDVDDHGPGALALPGVRRP